MMGFLLWQGSGPKEGWDEKLLLLEKIKADRALAEEAKRRELEE
jgi:hypothetical protein